MRKRVSILVVAVLVLAAVAGCLAACDKENGGNGAGGADMTKYNEIVSRLDAAGYSVTAGEGTTGASMVATGQFAAFADVNVIWSIYGMKMLGGATSIPDMVCIVGFASIEDAEKYETAMVELVNSQLEAQGMDIRFESLADYMAYFGETGINLPMVYEMRGDCFVYATGSGAEDAFGE